MPLLSKLKQVRKTKQNYFTLQHRFFRELAHRYPYIMEKNMDSIKKNLSDELHILLCTALRYKSVKIRLKAVNAYGDTTVAVQRSEPGFYFPQSQRGISDIDYMNLNYYVNDKDDLWRKESKEGKRLTAKLSDLRKNKIRVDQKKLEVYFRFMKEVMLYRPNFLCYTEEGYQAEIVKGTIIGRKCFFFCPRSFDIVNKDERDDFSPAYYSRRSNANVLCLLDYNKASNTNFSKDVHDTLKFYIHNYDAIRTMLDYQEIKKRKAYKVCKEFLRRIKVHTLPFKVLKEITKE